MTCIWRQLRLFVRMYIASFKVVAVMLIFFFFLAIKMVPRAFHSHFWVVSISIQKTKIMTSGPITSWHIDGEAMETVRDFIFLGSKVTTDGDYSYEIKRRLLLGRKLMTNLDSILKSRDQLRQHIKKQRHYSANKGPSSQGYGFSSSHVWM